MLEIAELKKQHPVILCTEIGTFRVFFRPLSKTEYYTYIQISSTGLVPQGRLEDHIFREIVLDPSVIDEAMTLPAGIIPSIVGVAFAFSGNPLSSEEEVNQFNIDLAEVRAGLERNPYDQFSALICKAFPAYKISDIEEMSYPYFLKLLAMAESVSGLEEPIRLSTAIKKKDFTESIFEDVKKATQVDRVGNPSNLNLKDELHAKQQANQGVALARQRQAERQLQRARQRR